MEGNHHTSVPRLIRDLLVIGGLIAVANWLSARNDLGWLDLNPTPWLLLPLLMGLRYGVPTGLFSSAATGLAIAFARCGKDVDAVHDLIQDHPYFFSSLFLAGLLAGETQRALRRENAALRRDVKSLGDEQERSRAELELSRETRQQLQTHLALHNASLAGIDDDLRKVITGPADGLMDRLVALLHQHGGLTSAALYRRHGDKLSRMAALNPTGPLPPELHLDRVPIARRAFTERAMVSVKAPLETTPAQPFLAALPFADADGEGVLLVQDMPLETFNWAHFARLEMILLWASSLQLARAQATDERQVVPAPTFQVLLGHALATEAAHHVPSIIVKIQGGEAETARKPLLALLPATATAATLPQKAGLAILLPFGGESDAATLVRELQKTAPSARISQYLVGGGANVEDFWAHILKP